MYAYVHVHVDVWLIQRTRATKRQGGAIICLSGSERALKVGVFVGARTVALLYVMTPNVQVQLRIHVASRFLFLPKPGWAPMV